MKQIFLAFALILMTTAAAAEKLSLRQLSDYLNQMILIRTTFTRINNDGSTSTGRLWLQRPGKMRMEYDPPNNAAIVVRTGTVYIFDPKSNQPPKQYPLRRTPISLLLARVIDLEHSGRVSEYQFDGQFTTVTLRDQKKPKYERIDLVFTSDPIKLHQWVIHDNTGDQTTVIPGQIIEINHLDRNVFSITSDSNTR